MERVKVKNGYYNENYVAYVAEPATAINFGGRQTFIAFDYASLAKQWGISMEVLELISGYDLEFKVLMYEDIRETEEGKVRTKIIHANIVPALLRKIRETGRVPNLDVNKELYTVNRLIMAIREKERMFFD